MTDNRTRFPAEWEEASDVLLALPDSHTDWAYILEEARQQYVRLIGAIAGEGLAATVLCRDIKEAESLLAGVMTPRVRLVQADYNDTWTRDYGPLTVVRDGERIRLLDFGFNGWGLKFASDKDNLVNMHLASDLVIHPDLYRNNRDYVLEGGSVESNGAGTILTTTRCLCSPNRNGGRSKGEINHILAERLGADHVLWLDHGYLAGDDTDSHIDTLARLAPDDIILFTGCRDMDDEHFEELLKMRAQLSLMRTAEGNPFNLVELPLPSPIYDEEGQRLPATYANYLVYGDCIFMPVYNQPENDLLACRTIKVAYPAHKVVPVDCTTLIKQHGSLHCATMQLYETFNKKQE
ncbi:MAG: agmatine deiminase family protein [Muribaculaceae bacterium]|nr:agmatine deiminase family protein [Muribaculaceae bacterium]